MHQRRLSRNVPIELPKPARCITFWRVYKLTCSLWLIHNTLALILAGLAGTIPNTTYSGNIAIVELTGVASRQVGILEQVY